MLSRSTTRVLGLLCVMYFITYVDRVNVSTAAIVFGKEFNLSNTQDGFVFSAFAYPYLVFQIIGGWLGGSPRWSLPASCWASGKAQRSRRLRERCRIGRQLESVASRRVLRTP